jgi:hypothetical protein
VRAPARTLVLAPAGVIHGFDNDGTVHTFANASGERLRMLDTMAPGGFEQYLKEVAAAGTPEALADRETMAAIASRYDLASQSYAPR